MTPQPQQEQPTIDRNTDYIVSGLILDQMMTGSDNDELFQILTSHPAPSHLEPDDRGWDQGFQDGQASALVDLNVYATTIRKDEREKRIKDYEHLKTHIIETCNYHGGNWIVDQIINRINHRINFLRSPEAQP